MSYQSLIQKLFQTNLFGGMKLGLENAQRLQQILGFPDRSFLSIHVAGTNGKGSVSTKIAKAFQEGGYRVGLFTSPHISSFRERIKVNGHMISEESVESLLSNLFQVVEDAKISATFFEITTFLAFLYFMQEKVDFAVIETGLGGRLDATNVIYPCLSIITSISLDHTEILGHTEESIAQEKGGIIKKNIPVVIGPRVPFTPIHTIASHEQSFCLHAPQTSPLFEEENRSTARTALNYLAARFSLSPEMIEKGLEGKQPCRFEILPGPPLIVLDVAHNPDGLQHLFQMTRFHYPNHSLRILFGISKHKDIKKCLEIISQQATHFHLVEAKNGRGASISALDSYLHTLSIHPTQIFKHESIHAGVQYAQQQALKDGQLLVICGSFFIMGEVRKALGFSEAMDAIDLNERASSPLRQ